MWRSLRALGRCAIERENETLVVLALAIKDKLGYLKVAAAPPPPAAPVAAERKPAAADTKKYLYGPRSWRAAYRPRRARRGFGVSRDGSGSAV